MHGATPPQSSFQYFGFRKGQSPLVRCLLQHTRLHGTQKSKGTGRTRQALTQNGGNSRQGIRRDNGKNGKPEKTDRGGGVECRRFVLCGRQRPQGELQDVDSHLVRGPAEARWQYLHHVRLRGRHRGWRTKLDHRVALLRALAPDDDQDLM